MSTGNAGSGAIVAHPDILGGLTISMRLQPITPLVRERFSSQLKLVRGTIAGVERKPIVDGQVKVIVAQDKVAMKTLFPNSKATGQDWGDKVLIADIEELDCDGASFVIAKAPQGKIQKIENYSNLPPIMQDYVKVRLESKAASGVRIDALAGAQDQKEDERILGCIKAIEECEDENITYALPAHKDFDKSKAYGGTFAKALSEYELTRRFRAGKIKIAAGEFPKNWTAIDHPTVLAHCQLFGRDVSKIPAKDLAIPNPLVIPTIKTTTKGKATASSKTSSSSTGSTSSPAKASSTTGLMDIDEDEEDELLSDGGTPLSEDSVGGKVGDGSKPNPSKRARTGN